MHFTEHVSADALVHGHCRSCDQEIVLVPDVGWVDPTPGDTYDMCPGDPFGNHQPDPAAGFTGPRRTAR